MIVPFTFCCATGKLWVNFLEIKKQTKQYATKKC